MKVEFIFAWYDLWIGFFWDKKKKWLYILPLPTIGIILKFGPVKCSDCRSRSECDRLGCARKRGIKAWWMDEGYEEFLEETAKNCRCCPECNELPCGGCLSGGFCDATCNCDDEYDYWYDDEY